MIFCGDGEPYGQYGAGPGRAVQGHGAAYGLDPVAQADQARAASGVGAADAIIADLDGQRAVGPFDEDVDRGGCRVLGGVGEGLGGDVIRGCFVRRATESSRTCAKYPPLCRFFLCRLSADAGMRNRVICVRHEAHCYIARVAGMDWRRCLWI